MVRKQSQETLDARLKANSKAKDTKQLARKIQAERKRTVKPKEQEQKVVKTKEYKLKDAIKKVKASKNTKEVKEYILNFIEEANERTKLLAVLYILNAPEEDFLKNNFPELSYKTIRQRLNKLGCRKLKELWI